MSGVERLSMITPVLALVAALLLAPSTYAGEIVVGNDAVDRPNEDTRHNWILKLTTEVFPIHGIVTDWGVYASEAGTLALLIFNGNVITGADYATVSLGLNTFAFEADSGSDEVFPGYTLGLWLGSANVDFTRNDGSGDSVEWCAFNGCARNAPVAGQTVYLTGGGTSNSLRQYSVYAIDPPIQSEPPPRAEVPTPGMLSLLLLGLAGLGFSRISTGTGRQKLAGP